MSDLKFQLYLEKIELTKQRIEKKSFVEKNAIQGLCLLGAKIDKLKSYLLFDQKQKNSNRKRFYRDFTKKKIHRNKNKKKKFTKTKKIVLELEKPIGQQGELIIKTTKQSPNRSYFVCPSNYPFHLFEKQYHSNFLLIQKRIQKVIVRNI
ncbi:hypothetical protein M0812_04159 [Anaeramoeba flamelloides]|uniref:Uncharacterized protein n=1 Tax=Anaeramoeba flamelloides TaxID=1746091 RepID=A0AAV8AHR4_9EUKA|nr:hypothetical protein M0812_04159 [Anaeramoeba flamelloides]